MDIERNYGFLPSVMDGTEIVFSASFEDKLLPQYCYKEYLPQVIDQGALSICVPCSLSAYLNWKKNLEDGDNKRDNKIALMDIYNCRTTDGDGMTFKEALHYLRHNGVRSESGVLKITRYARVKDPISLKSAILMNGPCVGALPVYSEHCDFWVKHPGDRLLGYHAIAIVGFDKDGFIIRNSWGRSFCDKGYTTLDYEEFDKLLEAWTMME